MVEVIQILNNIPEEETVRTIRSIGAETNVSIILSTLRDAVKARGK